jgi:hypothetical protein
MSYEKIISITGVFTIIAEQYRHKTQAVQDDLQAHVWYSSLQAFYSGHLSGLL